MFPPMATGLSRLWKKENVGLLFWKSACDFSAPRSDLAPVELSPCLPRYVSGVMQ